MFHKFFNKDVEIPWFKYFDIFFRLTFPVFDSVNHCMCLSDTFLEVSYRNTQILLSRFLLLSFLLNYNFDQPDRNVFHHSCKNDQANTLDMLYRLQMHMCHPCIFLSFRVFMHLLSRLWYSLYHTDHIVKYFSKLKCIKASVPHWDYHS